MVLSEPPIDAYAKCNTNTAPFKEYNCDTKAKDRNHDTKAIICRYPVPAAKVYRAKRSLRI